ncbi:uncharacterized protein FFM5_15357 [Fusarium fujikuroi]|nr:uncharacterized protein FFM5_15357 [Fusarium fujikuroi]
MSFRYSP